MEAFMPNIRPGEFIAGCIILALALFAGLGVLSAVLHRLEKFSENGRYQMGLYDTEKENPAVPILDTRTGEFRWEHGWYSGSHYRERADDNGRVIEHQGTGP